MKRYAGQAKILEEHQQKRRSRSLLEVRSFEIRAYTCMVKKNTWLVRLFVFKPTQKYIALKVPMHTHIYTV